MKRVFREIQSRLVSLSEGEPKGNALKRINNLSGLVAGMIRKGSSHLPDIGSGLIKNIDSASKTKAAKRFVGNKWIDAEVHFLPFLKSFIQGILAFTDLRDGIVLVIDGSQTGKNNAALMVSLVWRKRGIPICWYVKKGGKGHFKTDDHIKVVEQAHDILVQIIPNTIPITLLGDGEFDSIKLQELSLSNQWNYVLRTACNTVLYKDNEPFYAKSISPEKYHDSFFIPIVEFTKKRFKFVNFVCWHNVQKHDDPIFLVSNLDCPKAIIEYYNLRYSIECLFKDMKSTSFNIHKTRLQKPEEVKNIILIAALAFILLTVLVIEYDTIEWRKKVQRVRKDRKVLSFFTFAYKLLHYFIDYEINFKFSFQFSKNFDKLFSINT